MMTMEEFRLWNEEENRYIEKILADVEVRVQKAQAEARETGIPVEIHRELRNGTEKNQGDYLLRTMIDADGKFHYVYGE